MNRQLINSAIVLAIVVWFCDAAIAQIDLSEHNVIPNPSFERGKDWPESWSRIRREGGDRVQFKWDDVSAHSGQRSILIYSEPMDATSWGAFWCDLPLRGGIKWYFSGWWKSEGITQGGLTGWLWNGKWGSPIGAFGGASATSDWCEAAGIIDVANGDTSVPLGVELRRASGRGWADDLLAVPYFLKLTADLQVNVSKFSAQELASGPADLHNWQEELSQLSTEVVRWRNEPIERLQEYERKAMDLEVRLEKIENRIAVARFTEPLIAGYYAPVTSVYRAPIEWPASDFDQSVIIRAMRGETESFQLALLSPDIAMERVEIAIDGLISASGKSIAPEQIKVYRVDYVKYQTPVRTHGNLWPDVLVPSREFQLSAGHVQPVWIDIEVPRNQAPGTYDGRVRVVGPAGIRLEKPVQVIVYRPVLPRPTHMKAVMTTVPNYHVHNQEERERIAFERVSFLARHHVRPHLKFQEVDFMLKAYEMIRNDFGFKWFGMEGLGEDDKQRLYDTAIMEGWIDGLYCNVWDEAPGDQAVPQYRDFKKKYPLAKTLLTLSEARTAIRPYQDVVDVWCPDATNWKRDPEFHLSRKYRWHYFCMTGAINHPTRWRSATGTEAWKMKAEGFFYWCAIASTAFYALDGDDQWVLTRAGDGGIVYPDPRSPISLYGSIRLKHTRDGIEDWELFHHLRELVDQRGDPDLKTRAKHLLQLEPQGYEPYPQLIRRVRREAFELVEALETR